MTTAQKIRQITRRTDRQLQQADRELQFCGDTFVMDDSDDHDTLELNSWLEELRIQSGPHRPLTLECALADLSDDYPLNHADYVC